MKIDLTDLSPVKKRMAIEVAPEDVQRETDDVLRGYASKAQIPGFRRGKAPISVIRSHFARELEGDVRDRVVTASFRKAAQQKGLTPLGEPTLEDLSHEQGRPLTFKTTFEVLPSIAVKSYERIEVSQPVHAVSAEDVEQELEGIRRSRTQFVAEEGRPASNGDMIYVDVLGQPAGGERFERERLPIEIGSASNIKEFNENLAGAAIGQLLEFAVDYPQDYGAKNLAGTRVDYRMTVREIKRPVVPALDDEFAKDLGEFENLEALRAKIREDLTTRNRHQAELAARQAVLNKVLIENPVVLPDVLVEHEIRRRLEDLVRGLIMRGVEPEKARIDWEDLRRRQEEPARKAVHARLILDAIARAQGLRVEQAELERRFREAGWRLGPSASSEEKRAAREALCLQLLREKSLDYLTTVANIHYAD